MASDDFRTCIKAITVIWINETPETWDNIKTDFVALRRAEQGWREVGAAAKKAGPEMRKEVQELLAFTLKNEFISRKEMGMALQSLWGGYQWEKEEGM